jgi:hypothetical protein
MRNGAKDPNVEILPVANNYATAICRGDCLKRVSDGTVAVCAAGDSVDFVADGIDQYNSSGVLVKGNRVPANTTFSPTTVGSPNETRVRCIPVRGVIFEADVDTAAASVATAQGLVGNNFDIVATAGSSTTGRSGHVINGASGSGTATATWRLVGICTRLDNDVTSANWKGRFVINESNDSEFTATGV